MGQAYRACCTGVGAAFSEECKTTSLGDAYHDDARTTWSRVAARFDAFPKLPSMHKGCTGFRRSRGVFACF